MSKDINTNFKDFTSGYSIEVIPRSAAKIESFSDLLPKNTRVYLAHLETEDIAEMIAFRSSDPLVFAPKVKSIFLSLCSS